MAASKGFTLIELLVVVGVVLVLGATSANIVINLIRSYNKAVIMGEIEQNGNYVLSLMENQIRGAVSVAGDDCVGTRCLTLTVTPQQGEEIRFEFVEVSGVGVVRRTVGSDVSVLTNDDPSTGVSVDVAESYFDVSSATPPTVKIVLKLQQAPGAPPGRVDYQATTTLQTTVVVRGGYE